MVKTIRAAPGANSTRVYYAKGKSYL
jgi:DTW domain-containing protein YfiP